MVKTKKEMGEKSSEDGGNQSETGESPRSISPKAYDNDSTVCITMAQEVKDEGNKLFQKRDIPGALLKYEIAVRLLPEKHKDEPYLRSNMAACYMQMGISEYPKAIQECDLALKVTPNYTKALMKRARCYEALNRLDFALRDVGSVLKIEPDNVMALEVYERVKKSLEEKGLTVNDTVIELPPDYIEPSYALPPEKVVKEKSRKKRNNKNEMQSAENKILEKQAEEKSEEKKAENSIEEKKAGNMSKKKDKEKSDEKKAVDKEVVEEKINRRRINLPKRPAKLVFGEDIRSVELPVNCSFVHLRAVIRDRFPSLGALLVKYKDQESDLVTIMSDEELRWAETSVGSQGSVRLYIIEANPEQDPLFEKPNGNEAQNLGTDKAPENGSVAKEKKMIGPSCTEDWIIWFAQEFKNHIGFESDKYLDIRELGMKLYSEAMEETVTSEEVQGLFDMAGDKFQEMAALALFNWGNVHMSRARKKVYLTKKISKEHLYRQIKSAYDWVQKEYTKAKEKYEAAIKMKSDFYEGFLALGQQQFEQAKLSWFYAISSNVDLATWPSTEVLQLYDNAEDNMEKGVQIWEKSQEQCLSETSKSKDVKVCLQNMGLDGLFKNISSDEIAAQVANMRSQINLLWGTMLYERSTVEFKLGLPTWHECLEVAVEKSELAGVSPTDVAAMLKNHCSNTTAIDGFEIDEILQSWNEMFDAKKLRIGVPSFCLEPLFRRRMSNVCHALEHA